jgi:hypothetical protein
VGADVQLLLLLLLRAFKTHQPLRNTEKERERESNSLFKQAQKVGAGRGYRVQRPIVRGRFNVQEVLFRVPPARRSAQGLKQCSAKHVLSLALIHCAIRRRTVVTSLGLHHEDGVG